MRGVGHYLSDITHEAGWELNDLLRTIQITDCVSLLKWTELRIRYLANLADLPDMYVPGKSHPKHIGHYVKSTSDATIEKLETQLNALSLTNCIGFLGWIHARLEEEVRASTHAGDLYEDDPPELEEVYAHSLNAGVAYKGYIIFNEWVDGTIAFITLEDMNDRKVTFFPYTGTIEEGFRQLRSHIDQLCLDAPSPGQLKLEVQ